nr:glycosyltransferase family 4 protein [uncultured Carboxylicivirga sp.]
MKVVLINKTNVGGGAAVAASRLNHALRQNGVDSELLVQDMVGSDEGVSSAGSGFLYKQKAFARFVAERLYFLPHEKDSSIRFSFSPGNTGIDISDHPLVQEADIIHLHWVNQGFLSIDSLAKLFALRKPIVWTQHDMWAFTGGCHYTGSCQKFLHACSFCPFVRKPGENDLSAQVFVNKRMAYNNALLVTVSCSNWLKNLVNDSILFRNKMNYSIPNPIDTTFYQPKDKLEQRKKLGLPLDKKLILFGAANVNDPRKGMRYFMEALDILNNHYPDAYNEVELLVFGKMKENVLKQLPFKAHAFNFVSDPKVLVSLYNSADIYCLPSQQDNLPNTVMEAMACGTPVVAFGIGGVPEMVTHQQMGYLAKIKNSMSLADGLYDTLYNADLVAYSKAARLKVEQTYSEDIVVKQYMDVYEKIMAL